MAVTLASLFVLSACGGDSTDGSDALDARQAEVAERGADVMPFDLDATLHRFEPVKDGLVQTVIAEDPGDEEQITLIRQHLTGEAERFRDGDYGDPESIHGADMPGLAELEAGADAIEIEMIELPHGAQITYTTGEPELVDALHRWGEAQVTDHGDDAEHVDGT